MLVSQVYFQGDQHAFHLYLNVPEKGENTLMSTIPHELIQKYFPLSYATLKYGYFENAFTADKFMNILAERILKTKKLAQYYYPDYLLKDGRANFNTAEALIKLLDNLPLYSRTHYCQSNCPLLFWTLTIKFMRMKRNILKTGFRIEKDEFEDYVINDLMKTDFAHISSEGDVYLTLAEYGQVEYVLVINKRQELKFFISL